LGRRPNGKLDSSRYWARTAGTRVALSTKWILAGDGYIECTITETYYARAGLRAERQQHGFFRSTASTFGVDIGRERQASTSTRRTNGCSPALTPRATRFRVAIEGGVVPLSKEWGSALHEPDGASLTHWWGRFRFSSWHFDPRQREDRTPELPSQRQCRLRLLHVGGYADHLRRQCLERSRRHDRRPCLELRRRDVVGDRCAAVTSVRRSRQLHGYVDGDRRRRGAFSPPATSQRDGSGSTASG